MSEVTPIVDDQEMLRAYAETIKLKDAEIERLKGHIDVRDAVISKLSGTVAEWRPLLTRAAAALDYATAGTKVWCNFNKLIAELRKAAE